MLIELAIFGIVGLIGALSGWHTLADYAVALRYAGITAIIAGLVSLYGGFESGRSLTYIIGSMSLPRETVKQNTGCLTRSFVLCGVSGGIAILLSILLA